MGEEDLVQWMIKIDSAFCWSICWKLRRSRTIPAKRLQYDVSYISKWVSGRHAACQKTESSVMEGISACVVDEATDDGRDLLLREYSVKHPQ